MLGEPASYLTFSDFLASGTSALVREVSIAGVIYRARAAEPLHDDFKYQDEAGGWWSPDYYVVVTGGQSNMVGSGTGGSHELSGNVQALDPETLQIVDSSYGAPFNTGDRDNLYLPFANEVSAALGRPVLVVTGAVSGSVIDSWLESGDGTLWDILQFRVTAALALIGQDHVDSFLWLQGESNATQDTPAEYAALVTEFIAQVRGQDWAKADMAFLVGELSREGINATQNQALQALELALRNDAYLRFVSSTGLTSADEDGVHFDGASLDAYGHRFFEALGEIIAGRLPDADLAPVLDIAPEAPSAITLREGEVLHLSADLFFRDPEGDSLWLYGSMGRGAAYFLGNEDGDLVLSPGYAAAGTYTLSLYASDYWLDSERTTITVTILDRDPGVEVSGPGFTGEVRGWALLDQALAVVQKSRAIEVLEQAAVARGHAAQVCVDNLSISGEQGIRADFVLTGLARRLTLVGEADFDVRGSAEANTVFGNEGVNRLLGGAGMDRLYGGDGEDWLDGGTEQDFLFGGDGEDVLIGRSGDDRLYGGEGEDRLVGQVGRDQSWGGAGDDCFVFSRNEGLLVVHDFELGHDLIEIERFRGIDDFASLLAAGSFAAFTTAAVSGVRLFLGGQQLQLYGLTLSDVTAELFVFS